MIATIANFSSTRKGKRKQQKGDRIYTEIREEKKK